MEDKEKRPSNPREDGKKNGTEHPEWIEPNLIEATLQTWQQSRHHPLSRQEAINIILDFAQLVDAVFEE